MRIGVRELWIRFRDYGSEGGTIGSLKRVYIGIYRNDGDLGSRIGPSRSLWVVNRVHVFNMETESGVTWNLKLR